MTKSKTIRTPSEQKGIVHDVLPVVQQTISGTAAVVGGKLVLDKIKPPNPPKK
jgi:hypothetical protein